VIRELVRDVYGELNRSLGKLYASEGRPSIAPEQLLSALLLQVLYGIRSERQPMEQLDYLPALRVEDICCSSSVRLKLE
jgi:transposase